jgi:hypothetical protein
VRAARRNPEAFVLGLDLSRGQIARAYKRGLVIPNVGFGVADALCLPLAPVYLVLEPKKRIEQGKPSLV